MHQSFIQSFFNYSFILLFFSCSQTFFSHYQLKGSHSLRYKHWQSWIKGQHRLEGSSLIYTSFEKKTSHSMFAVHAAQTRCFPWFGCFLRDKNNTSDVLKPKRGQATCIRCYITVIKTLMLQTKFHNKTKLYCRKVRTSLQNQKCSRVLPTASFLWPKTLHGCASQDFPLQLCWSQSIHYSPYWPPSYELNILAFTAQFLTLQKVFTDTASNLSSACKSMNECMSVCANNLVFKCIGLCICEAFLTCFYPISKHFSKALLDQLVLCSSHSLSFDDPLPWLWGGHTYGYSTQNLQGMRLCYTKKHWCTAVCSKVSGSRIN